jgi:uncharacterized protein (DUF2141 family)
MNPILLIVTITGLLDAQGEVGCALYRSATGFPMDPASAVRVKHPAKPGTVECRFPDLAPGRYAVAVSVDQNKNGKTDKNFVGMPTEPPSIHKWTVSNNARPKFRAPRFEEAAFAVTAGPEPTRITIQVAK